MGENTRYAIQHTYKEKIIIPISALYHNFDFIFMDKSDEKYVRTSDGFTCKVKDYSFVHICELEDDVKKIYNIDIWSFIKKWYSVIPFMENMNFLVMELEKYEK